MDAIIFQNFHLNIEDGILVFRTYWE